MPLTTMLDRQLIQHGRRTILRPTNLWPSKHHHEHCCVPTQKRHTGPVTVLLPCTVIITAGRVTSLLGDVTYPTCKQVVGPSLTEEEADQKAPNQKPDSNP